MIQHVWDFLYFSFIFFKCELFFCLKILMQPSLSPVVILASRHTHFFLLFLSVCFCQTLWKSFVRWVRVRVRVRFRLVAGCRHNQNRVGELSWLSSSLKSNFITIDNPEHVCESRTSSQQEQENLPPLQNLKVKQPEKKTFFFTSRKVQRKSFGN